MAVAYVDVLTAKRSEVVRELEDLRRQSSEIAARVATREAQLRNLDELLAMESAARQTSVDLEPAASGPTRHFLDKVYEVIDAAGQPIHYRALAQRLADDGIYVPGQDPAANLLTQMTRDGRFARAGGRGLYGLAEWPSLRAGSRATAAPQGSRPSSPSGRRPRSAPKGGKLRE